MEAKELRWREKRSAAGVWPGTTVYASWPDLAGKMQKYTVKGGLFSAMSSAAAIFFDRLSVAGARVDVFEQLALLLEEEGRRLLFQLRRPVGGRH